MTMRDGDDQQPPGKACPESIKIAQDATKRAVAVTKATCIAEEAKKEKEFHEKYAEYRKTLGVIESCKRTLSDLGLRGLDSMPKE